ncbi:MULTISPECIES: hypothetical protein [Bacillus cereus group]|uniref:hypothetical protein n=1 Tax=Bacillus cereus group TaxID=86661 RepID=UPI0015D4BEA2|nr:MULTISPECIES: hypothetical protein [Bacillus cereus group]MDF9528322.1 hypothetical protein [Bacillus cereus]MED4446368.1 hypothetical protein [Bacillus cereus]
MSWSNDCWKHSSHSSKCENHNDWWKYSSRSSKCEDHDDWWKHKHDNDSCRHHRKCKCFIICCHSNRKHW